MSHETDIGSTGDPSAPRSALTAGDIERLSRAARHAGIATLEWADADTSLTLRFDEAEFDGPPATVLGARPPSVTSPPRDILSPAVGLFRHRHPATGRRVAEPGERVEAGRIVGFVQAGVVLHPVAAATPCTLGAPLREDGAAVGFGTPLYVST